MVFLFCFSLFSISSKDIPETKEIYPGTNGKTQGETNEKRPATKAAIKETSLTLNVVIVLRPLKLVVSKLVNQLLSLPVDQLILVVNFKYRFSVAR
ncbi:hypothetical protein ES708_02239 [subsurface metagenome]